MWENIWWGRPTERYLRNLWDSSNDGAKILERFTEDLQGLWTQEYWGRATERYWRGVWTGVERDAKMVSRYFEDHIGNKVTEVFDNAGNLISKSIVDPIGNVISRIGDALPKKPPPWFPHWLVSDHYPQVTDEVYAALEARDEEHVLLARGMYNQSAVSAVKERPLSIQAGNVLGYDNRGEAQKTRSP